MQDKERYHELLMELINLKNKDYDKFMDKLYEVLAGEYPDLINDNEPVESKKTALNTMIQYFQDKEEYEKCAKLKQLSDSLVKTT